MTSRLELVASRRFRQPMFRRNTLPQNHHLMNPQEAMLWLAFASTKELWDAVDACILDNFTDSLAVQLYGPDINRWNVSLISNFSSVFDATIRNPAMATFNEPVSDWDMSSAETLYAMFGGKNVVRQNGIKTFSFLVLFSLCFSANLLQGPLSTKRSQSGGSGRYKTCRLCPKTARTSNPTFLSGIRVS